MAKKNLKLLNYIIENAFDFLETAIDEFNSKPKYSIMHFSIAIELFLKARLIDEHWSLIVVQKIPEKSKFENGDFSSITVDVCINKIRDVIGDNFPTTYQTAFKEIAKHRNKLVHFFHAEINGNVTTERIAREQCLGWYFLRSLFNQWGAIFSKYDNKIMELNSKMNKHYIYLQTVFNQIEPRIKNDKANNFIFRICPSCKFEASKKSITTENVICYKCFVCYFEEELIVILCPKCNDPIEISSGKDTPIKCTNCSNDITKQNISEILSTEIIYYDDPGCGPINCSYCSSHDSVIIHHKLYICTNCFEIAKDVNYCEWCSERQIGGDLKDSFLSGCEYCEGRLGCD